jgi:hypothetical protein
MTLFILIFSFFPINSNINKGINPQKQLEITPFLLQDSNLSYDLSFDKQFKDDNFNIFSLNNSFYSRYQNKDIYFSLNYQNKRDYFSYNNKNEDINFLRDIKTNRLEFKAGFFLKNFSLIGVFNINLNKTLNPGLYLDYFYNSKNLKYRVFYFNYSKQEYELNILSYKNDIYNLKNDYSQHHNTLGFNLLIDNLFQFDFDREEVRIDSLNIPKGFSFDETAQKSIYKLKMKIHFDSYSVYFNYFEEIIDATSKGELDNTKYLKFTIKDYYNKIYKLGFIFKKITNLEFSLFYQSFDSYSFGNIEAWPFTDDSTVGWIGGRVNLSSKLNYNRFIFEIKNKTSINRYFTIVPTLSLDKVILYPEITTYEAGIFGIGKRNIVNYNKKNISNYIHISSLFKFRKDNYTFNLFLSQIIPISFSSSRGGDLSENSNTFSGFSIKFFVNYLF